MNTKESIAELDEKIRETARALEKLKAQRDRMIRENNKAKLAIHQLRKIRDARLAAEEKSE
jgi:regulator of replication initiation timing